MSNVFCFPEKKGFPKKMTLPEALAYPGLFSMVTLVDDGEQMCSLFFKWDGMVAWSLYDPKDGLFHLEGGIAEGFSDEQIQKAIMMLISEHSPGKENVRVWSFD